MASRFFQSGAKQTEATSDKNAERRAALVSEYGSSSSALTLINEIIRAEKEIAGLQRGSRETKLERTRERRLQAERIDERLKKLEEMRSTTEPTEPSKATAMEQMFPTVPINVLINAAKAQFVFIERLTSYKSVAYYETLNDQIYSPDWLFDFRELLEQHDPQWLIEFDQKNAAKDAGNEPTSNETTGNEQ